MNVRFDRSSLRRAAGRDTVIRLLESGFRTVEPGHLVRSALSVERGAVSVLGERLEVGVGSTWIIAVGKASVPMARTTDRILGRHAAGGIVVAPRGYGGRAGRLLTLEAGHPLPDSSSAAAAEAVRELAERVTRDDVVLCLLSGGASSLLASPVSGVTIGDLAAATSALLESGASIDEVNTVRRHLSALHGGGLARRLQAARVRTLILSDVIGSRLESIASGPTVPDPTTFADARRVLVERGLWKRVPSSVRSRVDQGVDGDADETAKPGDSVFERTAAHILGDNGTFVDAVLRAGARVGLPFERLGEPVVGEARRAGRILARRIVDLAAGSPRGGLLVGGGETTVTVCGGGRGGRNQELALAAAIELDGVPGVCLAALATDGRDGPTDAAGAVVDGATVARARSRGIDPVLALANNDAHPLLVASGDILMTGPTQTNVADVCVGWIDAR